MVLHTLAESLNPQTEPLPTPDLVNVLNSKPPLVLQQCEPALASISKARPLEAIFPPCPTAPAASHPLPATSVHPDSDGVVFKEAGAATCTAHPCSVDSSTFLSSNSANKILLAGGPPLVDDRFQDDAEGIITASVPSTRAFLGPGLDDANFTDEAACPFPCRPAAIDANDDGDATIMEDFLQNLEAEDPATAMIAAHAADSACHSAVVSAMVGFPQTRLLAGSIPSSFGQLSLLNKLSIGNTQLSGLLPASLTTLYTLSVSLDISFNNLTRPIPSSFGGMSKVQSVNLYGNSFSSNIPPSLELGTLPASFGFLDGLVLLDVSYNALKKTIPTQIVYGNTSKFSFVGNRALCGHPSSTSCGTSHLDHSKTRVAIIMSACLAGSTVLVALLCTCLWWWCFKSNQKDKDILRRLHVRILSRRENFMPRFKAWIARELKAAIDDFDAANVLGSRAVSFCYKVVIEDVKSAKQRVVASEEAECGG
ncbi:hypothetical protein L7F22_026413 [Adiantum nelumboides]|nr:hypothetical protein [Adiantum nelumboides]